MRRSVVDDGSVAPLADRFLRFVAEGRGDGARGRNLYALRFLDALGDGANPLRIPYRPTRNPGAFVAMVFDLVGDALHGYGVSIDGSVEHVDAAWAAVRRHVTTRLHAPWGELVADVERAGFANLASITRTTIAEGLPRPAVSDLPEALETIESYMSAAEFAQFDADRFVQELPLHRVLTLFRYQPVNEARNDREQHPIGGDLRALVRRRLDRPWRRALDRERGEGPIGFLAGWPFDVAALGEEGADTDFAVAYALATDAHRPGRHWPGNEPFVRTAERDDFADAVGRGVSAHEVRREARLRRWGVSATFPETTAVMDAHLTAAAANFAFLHAGSDWGAHVAAHRDALEIARRRFAQRVADALAEETGGAGGTEEDEGGSAPEPSVGSAS